MIDIAPPMVNAATARPPLSTEFEPVAAVSNEGAKDKKKPPSAQAAMSAGNTGSKMLRAR